MEIKYNTGVYPTMITPFKENGEIDFDALGKYVEWYFKKGSAGLFAICQSSEIWYLSIEEMVSINSFVYKKAKELEREYQRPFNVVSSGHTAETIEEQAENIKKVYESGTDAIILITNRLDINNEGDDVWIANAEKLLSLIPENIPLGMYECPYPYKRLVTPRILKWCKETGRFFFMKDTCCDINMIKERLDILRGSSLMLMNANAQTLLDSLNYGASGYSSIMANFHPELYVWLCENYKKEPERARSLQCLLGTVAFTEAGMPYPLTAKYNMCLEGIETANVARSRRAEEMTDYMKDSTAQMRELMKSAARALGIE
jgi:4-hydroxy-tetrahydrodipicolinate synthase